MSRRAKAGAIIRSGSFARPVRIAAGTRLGPYVIVAPLGAGGMGEVYRATDTRLHREVAIKVMADCWRDRPDLHARFRAEAESIAALSHPHICQLHDVGEQDGLEFLVMELVEGETLADRLARGRLPLDQALAIARDIADALDAAHRRGIVHRDLKPANIMLTRSGPRLLDFGLARLRILDDPDAVGQSTVAAHDTRLTQTGATLGTWRYMAPEQIRGGEADVRTDIFALGAVVYEMVSGRHAFEAASHRELVAAILEADPPSVPTDLPPALAHIVRACLEKQPDDRWQSAGDVRRALEAVQSAGASIEGRGAAKRVTRPATIALVTLAAVVLVAVTAGLVARFVRSTSTPGTRVVRSAIPIEPLARATAALPSGPFVELAFAPDGKSVVYGYTGQRRPLYRRALDDARAVPIPGTEIGEAPFFSPDGQWIGFWGNTKLMKVPATGGRPTRICNVDVLHGASWGEDGYIILGAKPGSGLFRVPASGGIPEPFTTLAPEDAAAGNEHRFPQVLPGGRGVLYAVGTGPEDAARIEVLDLRSGARKEIVRGSVSAGYVPTGHVVYARDGELFAMRFDLDRLEPSGATFSLATGVSESINGFPEFSFSPQGDLVYVQRFSTGSDALAFVDLQGRIELLPLARGYYADPRVSRDGSRIAFTILGAKNAVWVYDVVRRNATRVTFGLQYRNPAWTPDGRLTLTRGVGLASARIVLRSADGTGTDEELIAAETVPGGLAHAPGGGAPIPETWTPDGRTLVFLRGRDLWTASLGGGAPRPLVTSQFHDSYARVSPDGK